MSHCRGQNHYRVTLPWLGLGTRGWQEIAGTYGMENYRPGWLALCRTRQALGTDGRRCGHEGWGARELTVRSQNRDDVTLTWSYTGQCHIVPIGRGTDAGGSVGFEVVGLKMPVRADAGT